tara:strand:- start:64 stop:330 length:267 start_codon:yes stop_codon:yes gene_type:complete
MKHLPTLLLTLLILGGCGPDLTLDEKIDKAHGEYAKRHQGYGSSFLPRSDGPTRGDDYKDCMAKKYYRNKDPHDFCAWHAGIGKYQYQ